VDVTAIARDRHNATGSFGWRFHVCWYI
jgi:hypothetical protein